MHMKIELHTAMTFIFVNVHDIILYKEIYCTYFETDNVLFSMETTPNLIGKFQKDKTKNTS